MRWALGLGLAGVLGVLAWAALSGGEAPAGRRARGPAPVAAAPIERGRIVLARTYGGTLEAPARSVVAPSLGGRLERLAVNIGDRVTRGQVVAALDDAELAQVVAQARAELEVARANAVEAERASELAARELERLETLRGRGVVSASQLDQAKAAAGARQAQVAVTQAQVQRARAALDAARVRLGYTRLEARWTGGDDDRVVGERFVDEGTTVAADTPILSLVELDTLTAVIFVPERDYRHLEVGMPASLVTDAYPGERFDAEVARIAPVFQPGSRQARVELSVPNPDRRLKPGLFARVTVILETVDGATVVPKAALTTRGDVLGVFLLGTSTVTWRPVEVGIEEAERVQILSPLPAARVVTLGQHLLDDGSRAKVPEPSEPALR